MLCLQLLAEKGLASAGLLTMGDLARYITIYPQVIDLTYKAIQSLKGSKYDWRFIDCHHLATKLFFHAATINELSKGTNITLSDYKNGSHIIDFPSITVLARTVLDTYLKMHEIYFEPISSDEFEYRHAVYTLSGFRIREQYIPKNPDPVLQKRVEKSLLNIDDIRKRIKATQFFANLNRGQQQHSLKGIIQPRRKWDEIATAAGFGGNFISKIYAYQSAYMHGDSLSITQIADATTDEIRQLYIETSISHVIMVLTRMIVDYANKFPEAKTACEGERQLYVLVKALSKAASSMS